MKYPIALLPARNHAIIGYAVTRDIHVPAPRQPLDLTQQPPVSRDVLATTSILGAAPRHAPDWDMPISENIPRTNCWPQAGPRRLMLLFPAFPAISTQRGNPAKIKGYAAQMSDRFRPRSKKLRRAVEPRAGARSVGRYSPDIHLKETPASGRAVRESAVSRQVQPGYPLLKNSGERSSCARERG
jgi:hypothetical protein